ncbi:MAG: hypothetical protein N7Q72_02015 [Spiroplasma sp. Tabriz.8]|nr:hypothetical protein [Spiroplasma sp. Tabriz.8]
MKIINKNVCQITFFSNNNNNNNNNNNFLLGEKGNLGKRTMLFEQ